MALEQYIQRIEDKLHLLVKKLQQVQSENVLLREEITIQQQALQQQQQSIEQLEEKLHLMKIAASTQGSQNVNTEDEAFRKEVRGKINEYIKEIDRCIALLNG
ncbi:hypothetical protein SAMN05660909_04297 [Chitinophaga terrae (ex Kim and Jung 2007)]|jgi:predicted  nucleic acid-binding Zn-ribbon protein|uniref:Cell division protein ZapB n=1 Tax=Chitinophaga terrae (ex Kim and Jung 2007) TaxID=408074 RepID=A0A1H4FD03_9BACT|nr:hypothetical protein [Chitinophaga terrae (ex Kim and Jung 2007)]MDQ0110319.1 putative nucleic acid-binding Zn-ribbon protein [Chitinophaga terrae (ex Kim and Jung 2007)]GEP92442.1 hypothetical protein CTE07_40870 [Chitinophaga terrae (ex Kim and Jung 2007)]SEA94917.1 hypothetical protein SAMN05660909_04297 [Chitinophaga terrae (ex Kim and Jung 2007)]